MASLLVVAALLGACSSSKTASSSSASSGGSASTAAGSGSGALGTGVTASTIKIGVALVDFGCISQFVNAIRQNQQQVYQAFIDDINKHGGIAGRQIVPVYQTFCPIGNAQVLTLCTKFTEDDKVFAVIGDFIDMSGDAQTCVAKNHQTVLMTFELTDAIIKQSPPGLIVFPGQSPERVDSILFGLVQKQHTLNGKKVAVLGEVTSQNVVNNSVVPGLKRLGVPMGSTAILNIVGADTSAAQSQLDSFIERWKTEHVTSLFVSGVDVASQQFIEKLRAQMPTVQLLTDATATDVLGYGMQEQKAGRKPNPYEGIVTAGGPTSHEYDVSSNWKYCATIYQQQTGQVAPNAEAVIPGPNGKTLDTYGAINDACQMLTMFHDIATRAGKTLSNQTWINAVNNYGTIRNLGGGAYASLHAGKYDVDDTYRLEQFDSTLPPNGQWQPITPLEDITGS